MVPPGGDAFPKCELHDDLAKLAPGRRRHTQPLGKILRIIGVTLVEREVDLRNGVLQVSFNNTTIRSYEEWPPPKWAHPRESLVDRQLAY